MLPCSLESFPKDVVTLSEMRVYYREWLAGKDIAQLVPGPAFPVLAGNEKRPLARQGRPGEFGRYYQALELLQDDVLDVICLVGSVKLRISYISIPFGKVKECLIDRKSIVDGGINESWIRNE